MLQNSEITKPESPKEISVVKAEITESKTSSKEVESEIFVDTNSNINDVNSSRDQEIIKATENELSQNPFL